MAGHSKWSTIKRKKSKVDAERGKIFTKISREIMVAVKQGGSDPDGNFRLKLCIQKAKDNNMPNDNINRVIQKAAGSGDSDAYEELSYEGYGPGGTAVLCLVLTDNRNRTAGEIRYIFSRNDGNLGESGCVSWMFERKGQINLELGDQDEDELMMRALDAGAEDLDVQDGLAEVITDPELLTVVRASLEKAGFKIIDAEIVMRPANTVEITDVEQAKNLLKLIDALEENDDVQAVYSNYDIADEIMFKLDH
ncbi:MAG: YebC/PmpR family DNA-binding transcriptional regulator [Bacillota bacterium]|jgi:YebC/PmpR family DNA-binding regulatory protein